ncbi:unnamed protein product [Prorocentrum cordatum]|uniref:J domain-containing protein n=1 Tax=Prorocentrum cordatum TaxID=2364126 RepID=A0ABN9XS72_9DINO|nr:unnamed protein product [Polarella glacialis]
MGSGQSAAVADTSYYDLLGVEPTVSSAELQKAYKRRALRLHPDKGGDPDEFKRMKDAYDVLLNPDKRAAYDRYGPIMVGVMNGEAPTLDVIAAMFDKMTVAERARVVSIAVLVACFVLASPLMLALRWDGASAEPWPLAFLPLWLLEAGAACGLLLIPAPRPEDPADELDAEAQAVHERLRSLKLEGVACALVSAVTQALLAAKLGGSFGGSWVAVFCPPMLLECCWLARLPGFLAEHFAWGAARLAAWALVAARAAGAWRGSWLFCLVPLLLCEGLRSWLPPARRAASVGSQVRLRGLSQRELNGREGTFVGVNESGRVVVRLRAGEAGGSEEGQRAWRDVGVKPENVENLEEAAAGRCLWLRWLPWLLLGALKLDGWRTSAFMLFLPVFVPVCCLTCAFSCGICIINGELVKQMDPAQQGAREGGDGHAAESTVPYDLMTEPAAQP